MARQWAAPEADGGHGEQIAPGHEIRPPEKNGTTRSKTLKLREDPHGLAFELDLPPTSHGKDLAILVERGDVAGCSFGFRVREGGDRWEQRGAQLVRELLDVELSEVTLTADPAYADTSVALRTRKNIINNDTRRLWLETCLWD